MDSDITFEVSNVRRKGRVELVEDAVKLREMLSLQKYPPRVGIDLPGDLLVLLNVGCEDGIESVVERRFWGWLPVWATLLFTRWFLGSTSMSIEHAVGVRFFCHLRARFRHLVDVWRCVAWVTAGGEK